MKKLYLIFPIIFPLLVIYGRVFSEDGFGKAWVLVSFWLILAYFLLLCWRRDKLPRGTFPVTIWMMSLALLFSRSLLSDYLIGDDIYMEYHAYQVAVTTFPHLVIAPNNSIYQCLSITSLPALLNWFSIDGLIIFKVVLILPISLVPAICYFIYKRYISSFYSFLASFFFISQLPFIYQLSGHIRLGIALFFFSLAIYVMTSKINYKKLIALAILAISLTFSYYVTPFILSGLLLIWLATKILKKEINRLVLVFLIIPLVIIPYFWWFGFSQSVERNYQRATVKVEQTLPEILREDVRSDGMKVLYNLPDVPPIQQVSGVIQRLSIVILTIGSYLMIIRKKYRQTFGIFSLLVVLCTTSLVLFVLVPGFAFYYGDTRLYLQMSVIIAPAFVIGVKELSSLARCYKYHILLLVILLAGQYISASSLYQDIIGCEGREILDNECRTYHSIYVIEEEVEAAEWLGSNNPENYPVYVSQIRYPRVGGVFEYTSHAVTREFTVEQLGANSVDDSYILMREKDQSDFKSFADGRIKVYDNDAVCIYK